MKVLYAGSSFCSTPTLKRLFLIADEITFLDRPSVTFDDWGTIGSDSPVRRFDWTEAPAKVTAMAPPSGPAAALYASYIKQDRETPRFGEVLLDGLKRSDDFANQYVQLEANYGPIGKGRNIIEALRADLNLLETKEDVSVHASDGDLFDVSTAEARKRTFAVLATNASIDVTSALVVAEKSGLIPISDHPTMVHLLALRASDPKYVGPTARAAPYLGLEIAKTVVPDSALEQLTLKDIAKFREKARDAYVAWSTEINRMASQIDGAGSVLTDDDIAKAIAFDVQPKLIEFENDMKRIRDDLFGDIIKRVAQWEFPTLTLAHVTGLGAAAYFAAAVAPAIPGIVDYFRESRNATRRHAMSYLLQVSKSANRDRGDL